MLEFLLILHIGLANVAPASSVAESRLFGVVVGYNLSDDARDLPLHFADDDAMMNSELLDDLGAQTILLTQPDNDTKNLHPQKTFRAPTLGNLQSAIEEINSAADLAQRDGFQSDFFFFYSGHGSVANNEGSIQLADGKLKRAEFKDLLRKIRATRIHVIIDACKSYFLVFSRGAQRQANAGGFVKSEEDLDPRASLLLSTSRAEDSHEWEAYQSGVFSHEIRSALRGAADFDGDAKITFEEIAKFVFAANQGIVNPKFRPDFFIRGPQNDNHQVAVAYKANMSRLVIGPGVSGHHYLEDARGLRLADFHPENQDSFSLVLPNRRPLFIRQNRGGNEWLIQKSSSLKMATLEVRAQRIFRRGAEHEAFVQLFSQPFQQQTWISYLTQRQLELTQPVSSEPGGFLPWLWLGGAAVVVASGATMSALAAHQKQDFSVNSSQRQRAQMNDKIELYNRLAVSFYAVSGLGLGMFLVWSVWPTSDAEATMTAGPGYVSLDLRF